MKNTFLFRHITALLLVFTALNGSLNAQKTIEQHTDERYGNTTVVYKNTNSNDDAALLQQLDKDFGMGDVVRITVAPPKPQPAPAVAPKNAAAATSTASKATGTPSVAKPVAAVVAPAVAKTAPSAAVVVKTQPVVVAKSAPVAKTPAKAPALATAVTAEPAVAPPPTANRQLTASTDDPTLMLASLDKHNTVTAPVEQQEASAAVVTPAPVRAVHTTAKAAKTTTTAHKTTAKTASKSGKSVKYYKHKRQPNFSFKSFVKKHKPGRQQYKCPKF